MFCWGLLVKLYSLCVSGWVEGWFSSRGSQRYRTRLIRVVGACVAGGAVVDDCGGLRHLCAFANSNLVESSKSTPITAVVLRHRHDEQWPSSKNTAALACD